MARKTLQSDIEAALGSYTDEIAQQVKIAVRETANDTKAVLSRTSPGTRYRRGWKTIVREETPDHTVVGLQNTQYRLTHLLEKPHALRNGHMTNPAGGFGGTVHIAPAAKQAEADLQERIEHIIEEAK